MDTFTNQPDFGITSFIVDDEQVYEPKYIPVSALELRYLHIRENSCSIILFFEIDEKQLPAIKLSPNKLIKTFGDLVDNYKTSLVTDINENIEVGFYLGYVGGVPVGYVILESSTK